MRIQLALPLFLSASIVGFAGNCPADSVSLHSDQDFHIQVLFDTAPAKSTRVRLYSSDKLIRTLITNDDGGLRLNHLPAGKYRFVVPRRGDLEVVVLPEKSGLNGPRITWSLPKSKWVNGKKVAPQNCSILAVKED